MNLATSCNLVHVLTSYNLSFLLEPMQIVSSPLPSSSLWTYAAPLPSSPFLSFVVSQNSFNSIKLQISNPRFPLLLLHSEPHANAKLHYRSTHLSGYSAKSGSTRCPTNTTQGSQRKPSRVNNTKSILFANYQRKCHAQRRQMTLAIIIAKMIKSISQPRLTCRYPQTQPFISRDMLRYSCSKPKEKNCHSGYLHIKLSQYDNNSRVPACLRVQCTFSASVPVFTTTSVPGFTKKTATIQAT